jgi:hypothetical protein
MDEEIRHVTLNVVKSREELDSRNSVKGGTSFFEDGWVSGRGGKFLNGPPLRREKEFDDST